MGFWLLGGVCLIVTSGVGFVAGLYFEKGAANRAFQRARKSVANLYGLVVNTVDSAQEACGMLEEFPNLKLSIRQMENLDGKRTKLVETVSRIVDEQRERLSALEALQTPPEPIELEWTRTPADPVTELPDRAAFDANLDVMIEFSRQTGLECGLLLMKIDKLEQLRVRFGKDAAVEFTRKMSSLVCRSLRDEDLACQYGEGMFAVLIPSIESTEGRALAQTIRHTIRNHHFRVDEGGTEVLVTASFGYATVTPQDNADSVVDRARNALSKSQKKGRNQLHCHDGNTLQLCAVS